MRIEIEISDEEAAHLIERSKLWDDADEHRYNDIGWKLCCRVRAAVGVNSETEEPQ